MQTAIFLKPLKRTLNSTCLLVLIYFCILPFVFAHVRPLHYLDPAQAIPVNYRTLVAKLSRFLNTPANPGIVLLGSSLLLLPAVRCDDEMEGREPRYDQQYGWYIQDYAQAKYFERLLFERTGQPLQAANLAITGALVSDVYLIIKKAVATGKKPKLVVYGIAPRDFMTRELPSVTSTPVYEMLGDLSCLSDLVKHGVSYSEVLQFALKNIWRFYSEHGDYRALFTNWICSATGHPQTLTSFKSSCEQAPSDQTNNKAIVTAIQAKKHGLVVRFLDNATSARAGACPARAMHGIAPTPGYFGNHLLVSQKPRQNKLNDLDLYRRRYNPPDLELFALETGYFDELLRVCNESRIPIVVLNMPLTAANKSLLPSGILDRYKNMIGRVTAKYRVKLVDLETKANFHISDFEDSCHLNAAGGHKLYNGLVEILLADTLLACHLKKSHSASPLNNMDVRMSQRESRYY